MTRDLNPPGLERERALRGSGLDPLRRGVFRWAERGGKKEGEKGRGA